MDALRAIVSLTLAAFCASCALTPDRLAPGPQPARVADVLPETDPWFATGRRAIATARARSQEAPARNVILFVGDGMSLTTVTAARIFEGQLRGQPGEENQLAFERLPYTGLAKTYNTDLQVPDSAGTMTAMMSGVKTRAGLIGLASAAVRGDAAAAADARVGTLLEQAEARGLATGVISTARITHATPAATYAHAADRNWESDADLGEDARAAGAIDIARQLVEFDVGDGIDVVLGGGRAKFLPADARDPEHPEQTGQRADGRDLIAEWRAAHPDGAWVWRGADFRALDRAAGGPVLGLFEPSHMQFEADRGGDPGGEPSLAEMTQFAIERLARDPDGYFLMVEAGRIDHAHHFSNAYRALHDTIALSEAVRAARAATDPEDTLIVVTADHGHVFTIAGYPRRGNPILGLVHGPNPATGRPDELSLDASGLPYTTLGYANGPGHLGASEQQPEGPKRAPHFPRRVQGITQGRADLSAIDTGDPRYLQESAVPMLVETHSGEDVPVYAGGPRAILLVGAYEQSQIYHALRAAYGWDD